MSRALFKRVARLTPPQPSIRDWTHEQIRARIHELLARLVLEPDTPAPVRAQAEEWMGEPNQAPVNLIVDWLKANQAARRSAHA